MAVNLTDSGKDTDQPLLMMAQFSIKDEDLINAFCVFANYFA